MKSNQQTVEVALKKHFETNPVLKKIRAGEALPDREIHSLVPVTRAK